MRDTIYRRQQAALARGDVRFDPGRPCRHGHHSERYTRSGVCIACQRAYERARRRRIAEQKQRESA